VWDGGGGKAFRYHNDIQHFPIIKIYRFGYSGFTKMNLPGKDYGALDNMNYSSYAISKMAWEVETTEEYDAWFLEQDEDGQASIRMKIELLVEYGPHLSRPHADTLKGSKLANLKELRSQTESHVFRIAFLFDVEHKAILLIGGDKKGRNEKRFYRSLINQAEIIYEAYRR
jgi:hypothetical protein